MSGRLIPIALQDSLAEPANTYCRLLKVTPVITVIDSNGTASTEPGEPFGLTTLNKDIEFDDGTGLLTYKASSGYTSFAIEATADLSVDNSEVEALLATYEVDGFVLDAISRGVYDDATYVEYLVNYEALTDGLVILGSGTIGELRVVDGMVCSPELRSLTQTLKQKSIIEKGSVGCRVVEFGDERCKYPVETEWDSASVDTVGVESDRTFTISGSGVVATTNYYAPGVFKFTTGANAGRTYEIETYEINSFGDAEVTLAIPTERPITPSDEGEIRRDCTRQWEGHNSCQTYNNRLNYRGEPFRPVSESGNLMIPGAGAGGSDITTETQEN